MTTPERVVHIIDDDEALRRSLERALRSAGYATRVYATVPQFLKDASTLADGCILLDVVMPSMNGLQLLARLNQMGVSLPVIVMTGRSDVATAVAAMKAGAVDFLIKPIAVDRLVATIESASKSRRQTQEDAGAAKRIAQLTPREREVLNSLVNGRSNKLIAHELGLSVRTVELHRANMMHRLGVRQLAEAVRLAVVADRLQ